jgi:hypothetical protein
MGSLKTLTITILSALFASAALADAPLDLGLATGSTPYDRYMGSVKQVLNHLPAGQPASMDRACQLLREGRAFRYAFTEPYVAASPTVTASTHSGDCKAKALWLCAELNDPSVRFVIGKARANSAISHAWVYWKHDSRWFILDPTNLSQPIPADHVSSKDYIPFYSYSKGGSYRHLTGQSYAASNGKVAPTGSL